MKLSLPYFFLTTFSYFFFLQISIVFSSSPSPNTTSHDHHQLPLQVIALLSLKSSLNKETQSNSFQDWDPSPILSKQPNLEDPLWCSWSGIKCHDKTPRITSLDLSHQNLTGTIPSEIRYLSSLTHLNLSRNSFSGPLQTAIFELTELRVLDISHNNFNSTFPPGISKLNFLRLFDAYSNSFTGPLPQDIVKLRYLEQLNFSGSYFNGSIPKSYGSFPRLKYLLLAGNLLTGSIPPQLGFLSQLEHLEIGYNQFSNGLPSELGLLSNLKYIDISNNTYISGPIAPQLGNLTKLETMLMFGNNLSGEIPASFGNLKAMKILDLSFNKLSGSIPAELSKLKELTILSLSTNKLSGEIPEGIGEFPNLDTLIIWNNSLTGKIPQKLGLSAKLTKVDLSTNSLEGPIPSNICNGNKLVKLILFSNRLVNSLPDSLGNCTSLNRLRAQNNNLTGSIPYGLLSLPNISFVDLSNNSLFGPIPEELGNAEGIEHLNVSQNPLNSTLPDNIWNSTNLKIFSAISSKLLGKIPEFVGCRSMMKIELQDNMFQGNIPWDIGHCEKLLSLNLSLNSITGIIPWEISTLPSITNVDLSHNNLTGTIPSDFGNCSTLSTFNVAFNSLTGPIPTSGVLFPNLHPSSFSGNEGLCGGVLPKPCAADDTLGASAVEVNQQRPKRTAGAIVWIMAAAFGIGLFVLVAGTRCFRANYSRRFNDDRQIGPWKLTAFQRLNFTADDVLECLSMSNKILGMGSTGTVYKAEMPGGEIIAVKKLWGKQKENIRRRRGVLAEVEVLGNVRHRNIVRLLGCCSNRECTMLLYEYMPNGNLDDLLHGKNKAQNLIADWVTRYKIALGVAQGICYLHHDCDPVIVHRDLKPSNILLDGEMEARVADFGVAKLIQTDESMSVIAGSYGYIAPEYAYTLQVDEKSDIYSYGVVLMEILSGKRSVDAEFGDGNSIVDWMRTKIKTKDGIRDVLDKNAGAACSPVREEMMQMLRIALLCTSRSPADRPSMRDVVLMLQEAKPKRKLPELTTTTTTTTHHHHHVICIGGGGDSGSDHDSIPLPQKPPAADC
ncbi:leucine-rich repeat receptor-like protein kinase TDR [Cannabis sativa]|nr:leucine-rich repeat receptor-like protein kinase TDR [Cannabis sativa]